MGVRDRCTVWHARFPFISLFCSTPLDREGPRLSSRARHTYEERARACGVAARACVGVHCSLPESARAGVNLFGAVSPGYDILHRYSELSIELASMAAWRREREIDEGR